MKLFNLFIFYLINISYSLRNILLTANNHVVIRGPITSDSIAPKLVELNNIQTDEIYVYLQSPGGSVTAGMAIYDTMKFIKPDVSTVCVGQAASMGAFLLSGGAKGKRYCLPNARVMIHQPLGGFQGQASDFEIHAREILSIKEKLNRLMAEHTGQDYETVARDTDRDNFLSASEAKEYGLIDQVLTNRTDASATK